MMLRNGGTRRGMNNSLHCEKCHDMGYVLTEQDGVDVAIRCECYEKRMSLIRMKNSGIPEEFSKKGFQDFETMGISALETAKQKAEMYCRSFLEIENDRQNSIIFCGQPGSGKTHLGMAICNDLLNVYNVPVGYMAYRNAVTVIKQTVTSKDDYHAAVSQYCTQRLLYIDDLLKGRTTDADTNILYEIVNYRYMHNKPIIVSTEKLPVDLVDFDEAVGSRILEMCRGNIIQLQGKELNYRLS